MDQLQNVCDAVIDGGACRIGLESTVLSLTEARPRLLRPGAITQSDIEQLTGPLAIPMTTTDGEKSQESPGMLPSHYATKTPLYLVDTFDEFFCRPDVGALLFSPPDRSFEGPVKILSLSGNMTEAAANLYTAMQALDAMGLSAIIATLPEATGIGSAVNDRLRKASFKTGQPQTEHAKTPTRSPHS